MSYLFCHEKHGEVSMAMEDVFVFALYLWSKIFIIQKSLASAKHKDFNYHILFSLQLFCDILIQGNFLCKYLITVNTLTFCVQFRAGHLFFTLVLDSFCYH